MRKINYRAPKYSRQHSSHYISSLERFHGYAKSYLMHTVAGQLHDYIKACYQGLDTLEEHERIIELLLKNFSTSDSEVSVLLECISETSRYNLEQMELF